MPKEFLHLFSLFKYIIIILFPTDLFFMKRLLLVFVLFCGTGMAIAQQAVPGKDLCGFSGLIRYYEKIDPGFRERYEATFVQSQQEGAAARATNGQVYYIPVVFHVIYKTNEQNLHDSVLVNQLEVLNNAFRKRHSDTADLRSIFKPLSADAEIEFYLANVDPDGHPTTGIKRILTNRDNWGNLMDLINGDYAWLEDIKTTASGGSDPWPTSRYLNIWIADMTDPSLGLPFILGLATPPVNPLPSNWPPGSVPPIKDGVVLQYHIVGNNNPSISNISFLSIGTAGRTAVHEVGHYLGLRHIWGDPYPGQECTALGDDGIADTPDQASETDMSLSCPSPSFNTCTVGPNDLPDMWENYMDYSRDNCQRLFTWGQAAHMRSILSNQRSVLVSNPTSLPEVYTPLPDFDLFPQPASATVSIRSREAIKKVSLHHITGALIKSWSGSEAHQSAYDIRGVAPGNYMITVQTVNGSKTKRLIVNP